MAKKHTIEYVKMFIEEKHPGTICNFTEYKNANTKLDLICNNGHDYSPTFGHIQQDNWCSECLGRNKYTIEKIKKIIKEKHPGCKVKFVKYKSFQSKLDLICEKGHSFQISLSNILGNHWCAECGGTKKLTIEYVKEKIEELRPGTICNFTEYKNVDTKLDLICNKGHNYSVTFSDIKQGYWCAECACCKKYTIEDVKKYIKEKYPKAIVKSKEYIDNGSKLEIVCENGHIYEPTFSSIKSGKWCSECCGTKRHTIEYVKNYIEKNHPGAICNSVEYKNSHTKLEVICENGHKYITTFDNIQREHWCPKCAELKSEKYIRLIFKELTNKEFIKARPEWLFNDKTNRRLELDGFNEETKIAFECQGGQHYKHCENFHKTEERFKDQQYRDNLKKELCKVNNITLICVPAIKVKVNNIVYTKKRIKAYIEEQLNLLKR